MNPLKRLFGSSTLLVSILLPTLRVVLEQLLGIEVPWECVLTGVGAYGVKEAASKVRESSPAAGNP